KVFVIPDVETTLMKLFGDERANNRAVNFTSSFVVLGAVMGDGTKLSLAPWVQDGTEYELRRARRWDSLLPAAAPTDTSAAEDKRGPPDVFDRDRTSHTDIKVVSPIRLSLWDKAQWTATAFLLSARLDDP